MRSRRVTLSAVSRLLIVLASYVLKVCSLVVMSAMKVCIDCSVCDRILH